VVCAAGSVCDSKGGCRREELVPQALAQRRGYGHSSGQGCQGGALEMDLTMLGLGDTRLV
jgi:hypothetical protein